MKKKKPMTEAQRIKTLRALLVNDAYYDPKSRFKTVTDISYFISMDGRRWSIATIDKDIINSKVELKEFVKKHKKLLKEYAPAHHKEYFSWL